jgi:hypothetical protein
VNTLLEKATKQAALLQKYANIVMAIALIVYLGMTVLALVNQAWILVLFCTCLLLGVGVIYLLISTLLTHLELLRENSIN